MGFNASKMKMRRFLQSNKILEERLLVDLGAIYSVFPAKEQRQMGVVHHSEEELADGEIMKIIKSVRSES